MSASAWCSKRLKRRKILPPAERPGESPIPAPMEAIDGTRKLADAAPRWQRNNAFPSVSTTREIRLVPIESMTRIRSDTKAPA